MDIGCNRLENVVKPQHQRCINISRDCCNRLENAVKPQRKAGGAVTPRCCNRLENAVKPQQLPPNCHVVIGCNSLENAVKPQQNVGKTSLYSIFTYFIILFVDFIFQLHYIFLGHRAIRSATFLVLGVSDPTVSSNFSFFAFSNFPATFEVNLL